MTALNGLVASISVRNGSSELLGSQLAEVVNGVASFDGLSLTSNCNQVHELVVTLRVNNTLSANLL